MAPIRTPMKYRLHGLVTLLDSPKTFTVFTGNMKQALTSAILLLLAVGFFESAVAAADRVIFSVIDTTTGKTPDLMSWLDRTFGREVSSRTWKTVHRILAAMDRPSKT